MRAVSAECIVGDVNGTHYCDVSGDWKVLKPNGAECLNDYECESGTCSSDGTCGSEYSGLGGGDESQENVLEKIWNELGCILLKPFDKRKYCRCLYESNLTEYCNCLVKEGVELTSGEVFSCGFNECTPNNSTCDQTVEGVNSGCGIWCNGTKLVAICGANGFWDYSLSGYVEGYCGYSPSGQECTPYDEEHNETCYENVQVTPSCSILCDGIKLKALCNNSGFWNYYDPPTATDGFCGYSSNSTCTDDGKVYDQSSNCYNGSIYSDSCINQTYLKEYYCDGDSGSECLFEVHFCGEGYKCENGACIVNESGENCSIARSFKCVDKNLLVCTLQKKWKSFGKVSGYCENPAKGYIEFGNVTSSSYIPQNESVLQFIEKIEGLAAGEVGKIYLQISKNPDDFSDSFSTPSNSENFSLFYLAKIELDAESSGKIYFKVNSSEVENSSNVRSYVWEKADNLWNSLSIEFLGNSSGYSRFKVNTSHFSVFLIGEGRVDEECIPEWNCTEWSDPVHHCGFRECYAIRTCGEPPPAEFKDCDTDTGYCGDGICDPDYELCGDSDDPPECKSDCGRCEPQGSGSVCGNGKCEVGETTSNCPEDCKFTSGETKANGGRIPLLPKGEGKSTWAIVLAIVLILAGIGVVTFIILQRIKEQRKALMKSKGDSKSDKEGRGSAVGGGSTSGKPPGSSGGASERGKVLTRPQSFSNFPQRNV